MPRPPRLFVSHSSANRAEVEKVRDLLEEPGEPRIELLLDIDRLDSGRPWEPYLHEWLARCDAGLVLLTPEAAASAWVLKELTVLTWRLSLDSSFKLFIARSPSVTDDDLVKYRYGPLGLQQIQWLPSIEPAEIAREVRAGLDGVVLQPSPFDRLVGKLGDLLARVGDATLQTVADRLDVFPEWAPGDDLRTRWVQNLARHLLCGDLGAYGFDRGPGGRESIGGLAGLVGDMAGTTDPDVLRKILRMVAPYWVDGAAAGHLARLPMHETRRAVALNGVYVRDFTAQQYRARAHLAEAEKYYFLDIAGGNAGDLLEHYTEQICDAVRGEPAFQWMASFENERVVELLRTVDPAGYALVPPPLPGPEDLARLLDRFPRINFVLWTGPELDPDYGLERVDWAEPELDPGVEQRQLQDFSQSRATISRQERL